MVVEVERRTGTVEDLIMRHFDCPEGKKISQEEFWPRMYWSGTQANLENTTRIWNCSGCNTKVYIELPVNITVML